MLHDGLGSARGRGGVGQVVADCPSGGSHSSYDDHFDDDDGDHDDDDDDYD